MPGIAVRERMRLGRELGQAHRHKRALLEVVGQRQGQPLEQHLRRSLVEQQRP
jgi:hypothetical protein